MEMKLGRLYEASDLAGRAVIQFRDSGLEWELDGARKLYVDLQRRRLWFRDAEKATTQRLAAAGVGDIARREDAMLDLLFIRIELLSQRQKDAEKNALAAAAMFPDDWRRGLAMAAIDAALGSPSTRAPDAPASLDARSRWGLLRDLVAGKDPAADVAERAGAAEPELRRWAATRQFGAGHDEYLVEMRRRSDPTIPVDVAAFVTNEDEAVLLVEPIGAKTIVRLLRKGRVVAADVDGDADLPDFWDACWVAPSPTHLDAAAKRVSESLFSKAIVEGLTGVMRLWISVPEPLGPLPFELVPFGKGALLDQFEVIAVNSLTELSNARSRAATARPVMLSNPYATLDARNAIAQIGGADAKASARFLELVTGGRSLVGRPVAEAVRNAKHDLRATWRPDPKAPPCVPPWAAFLLRGAP
jgi:hypothetical protein